MAYQPTRTEGTALNYLALALRPEWTPRTKDSKTPGAIWWQEIGNGTFPHAENFDHCLAALTDYCRAEKQGKPRWTHPRPFVGEGDHWETTRPVEHQRPGKQRPCQDHTAYSERTCPVCSDEIAARQRSPQQRGKRIRKITPSPGILTGHAHDAAQ